MQTLRVAYNFGFRALYNLPWRASVSSHQVQRSCLWGLIAKKCVPVSWKMQKV